MPEKQLEIPEFEIDEQSEKVIVYAKYKESEKIIYFEFDKPKYKVQYPKYARKGIYALVTICFIDENGKEIVCAAGLEVGGGIVLDLPVNADLDVAIGTYEQKEEATPKGKGEASDLNSNLKIEVQDDYSGPTFGS